jgi:glycosyltransferase involved in cell wall biosynthesis
VTPESALDLLTLGSPERREAFDARFQTLASALALTPTGSGPEGLAAAVDEVVRRGRALESWLVLAVLTGYLPAPPEVHSLVRSGPLGDGFRFMCALLDAYGEFDAAEWPAVEVVQGRVVVDLHHTARNLFATGIQRVSREAARRWQRDHEITLVGWTVGYGALRRLDGDEVEIALHGRAPASLPPLRALAPVLDHRQDVIVPWKCVYIVPELPAEPERARRYQGFVTFSGCTTGQVGHDCVPLMAAETCADGMSLGFAKYLAAAARVDRIATVSKTAAVEYEGWRRMLAGTGLPGPEIRAIPNAAEARSSTAKDMEAARRLMSVGSLPVVLTVGSHEPRKNHLSLLHAAETLWREGLEFTLTFMGGNSWNSDLFNERVTELQRRNRPVQVILSVSDELLWAAYRVAYCTVFPSIHEGFGLPIAESLACGTPVITSDYGAMREGAEGGGALLVNPRDDADLTTALRRILTDRSLRDRLAGEAANVPVRTWDDFAAETWDYFVRPGSRN